MTDWHWNGARWWKFDLHTHTPASDDYGKGPNQTGLKQRSAEEWLLDYMRAGIDCVVITDHNTGAWIDSLKAALEKLQDEKPQGFKPLVLFPGVEISVNGGIHLLAVLGTDKTTSDVDTLLGNAGFADSKKGKSDCVTLKSFPEVIGAVMNAGGIAIPAHVDTDNGLFKLQGTTLAQAFGCESVFAMEIMDAALSKPSKYEERQLRWTELVGSDAHHPSGNADQRYPGSHFTWVKMGRPCLEGLKLALLDGPLSIKRADQMSGDPNAHASSVIESIEVGNARYMGRGTSFAVDLNPWLNTVIGGRGTGKSTLVEFLRTTLRRIDEIPEALESDFQKYVRVYENREDNGLLTNEAHFVIVYRKDATRYRIQWNHQGSVSPIEVETEPGHWDKEQGDVAQRFPIRIYSQKQIFELAKAPLALLRIVDDAPDVDRRKWQERWRELETRFMSLRARAREIDSGLEEEGALLGELEDVKRKLAIFEQASHAQVLKDYQKRVRQQRLVESWEESWILAGSQIREVARDLAPEQLDPESFRAEDESDRTIIQLTEEVRNKMLQVRGKLEGLADEAGRLVDEWRNKREKSLWQQTITSALNAYEELRQQLADQGVDDPSTYGELVQRRQNIETRLQDFKAQRKEAESIRRQANECLDRLLELRRELTDLRVAFLENVLSGNPYVKIHVSPYGAGDIVEREFRRIIQRESGGFEKDIGTTDRQEGLLGALYADTPHAAEIENRFSDFKSKVRLIVEEKHDPSTLRDQRFAAHLAKLPPEALDRLDLLWPEDSLKVEYSTTGDGSSFRSIQEGSPGQKTAALLAFLLSYGEEPIILDQPEDDLDNRLIYDLIVTQLRNIKQGRQVIVVTHNANIVVNGDAELVMALAARGGQTQKECSGSLQEKQVRDIICAVMEGGREAFTQRYRRIALENRYV